MKLVIVTTLMNIHYIPFDHCFITYRRGAA
jgi:hypothetical protein